MKKLLLISALMAVASSVCFAREAVSTDQSNKKQTTRKLWNKQANKKQAAKTEVKQVNNEQIVEKVQKYLDSLKTFESIFVQVDGVGNVQSGYLWIKRPDRIKMQYPKLVIIVKDNRVISYDKELKEKTETSIYSSPLFFLLNKKVNFKDNVKIVYARETSDAIFIKVCKKDEDAEGAVLLVFSKNPIELRQWIVFKDKTDEKAGIEISLFNWKTGEKIPDNIFDEY